MGVNTMRRFISGLFLGAVLAAPVVISPVANAKEHRIKRYYDRDSRDWHEWMNERTALIAGIGKIGVRLTIIGRP